MRLHPEPDSFAAITKAFIDGKLHRAFFQKQHKRYSLFFSDEGVFHLCENGLYTVNFQDSSETLDIYSVDSYDLLIDKSSYSLTPFRGSKLPLEMDEKGYELYQYKTTPKSPVTLHLIKEDTGLVTEVWFEFQESLLSNPSIKEDINTFLTC